MTTATPIGLAENPRGTAFSCGTCEYFSKGTCQNDNPKLTGKRVEPEWCCNLFDRSGMKVIIK